MVSTPPKATNDYTTSSEERKVDTDDIRQLSVAMNTISLQTSDQENPGLANTSNLCPYGTDDNTSLIPSFSYGDSGSDVGEQLLSENPYGVGALEAVRRDESSLIEISHGDTLSNNNPNPIEISHGDTRVIGDNALDCTQTPSSGQEEGPSNVIIESSKQQPSLDDQSDNSCQHKGNTSIDLVVDNTPSDSSNTSPECLSGQVDGMDGVIEKSPSLPAVKSTNSSIASDNTDTTDGVSVVSEQHENIEGLASSSPLNFNVSGTSPATAAKSSALTGNVIHTNDVRVASDGEVEVGSLTALVITPISRDHSAPVSLQELTMSISQARSISDALRVDWQRLCVLSTTDHPDEGENFMNSQDLTERIVVISVALMQATTRHEELVTQLQSLSQTKVTHGTTPSTIGATLPTQISHGDTCHHEATLSTQISYGDTCQHAATLPTWNSHGVPQSHEASPAEISHGDTRSRLGEAPRESSPSVSVDQVCLVDWCTRPVYEGHPYCCYGHGQLYAKQVEEAERGIPPSSRLEPSTMNADGKLVCRMAGCEFPCTPGYQFCSRTCGKLQMSIELYGGPTQGDAHLDLAPMVPKVPDVPSDPPVISHLDLAPMVPKVPDVPSDPPVISHSSASTTTRLLGCNPKGVLHPPSVTQKANWGCALQSDDTVFLQQPIINNMLTCRPPGNEEYGEINPWVTIVHQLSGKFKGADKQFWNEVYGTRSFDKTSQPYALRRALTHNPRGRFNVGAWHLAARQNKKQGIQLGLAVTLLPYNEFFLWNHAYLHSIRKSRSTRRYWCLIYRMIDLALADNFLNLPCTGHSIVLRQELFKVHGTIAYHVAFDTFYAILAAQEMQIVAISVMLCTARRATALLVKLQPPMQPDLGLTCTWLNVPTTPGSTTDSSKSNVVEFPMLQNCAGAPPISGPDTFFEQDTMVTDVDAPAHSQERVTDSIPNTVPVDTDMDVHENCSTIGNHTNSCVVCSGDLLIASQLTQHQTFQAGPHLQALGPHHPHSSAICCENCNQYYHPPCSKELLHLQLDCPFIFGQHHAKLGIFQPSAPSLWMCHHCRYYGEPDDHIHDVVDHETGLPFEGQGQAILDAFVTQAAFTETHVATLADEVHQEFCRSSVSGNPQHFAPLVQRNDDHHFVLSPLARG